MPTNRRRQSRDRAGTAGISEVDYLFYSTGPFFEAENYADGKTKEELKAFWSKHSTPILERYKADLEKRGPGFEGLIAWGIVKFES